MITIKEERNQSFSLCNDATYVNMSRGNLLPGSSINLTLVEKGQDLAEYSLLTALIAIFALGMIMLVGSGLNTIWQFISTNFSVVP